MVRSVRFGLAVSLAATFAVVGAPASTATPSVDGPASASVAAVRVSPPAPARPDVYLNYHGSEQLLGDTDAQWQYVRENLDGFWGHWSSIPGLEAQQQNTIELTRKVVGRKLVVEYPISHGNGSCPSSPFLEDYFYGGVPGVPGTGIEGLAPDIQYDRVASSLYAGENPNCWGTVGGFSTMLDKFQGQGYNNLYSVWQATNVMDIDVPNVVFPRIAPGSPGDVAYRNSGAVVIECHMDDCLFPSIRDEFFRVIAETHARGATFVWFTGYDASSGIGSSGWLENIQRTYNALAERGLWWPGDAVSLINYNGSYPALPERRSDGTPADTVTGILAWLIEQRAGGG